MPYIVQRSPVGSYVTIKGRGPEVPEKSLWSGGGGGGERETHWVVVCMPRLVLTVGKCKHAPPKIYTYVIHVVALNPVCQVQWNSLDGTTRS